MARRGWLHLVVPSRAACVRRVAAACRGGVDVVHLKGDATAPEYTDAMRMAVAATGSGACVMPHLIPPHGRGGAWAIDAGMAAPWVHCPAAAVAAAAACGGLAPRVRGASCHSVDEALAAVAAFPALDYLVVGTMYATPSHPGKIPEGPALLAAVRTAAGARCPRLVAIGGVDVSRVAEVCAHGATGVAVIRSVLAAPCSETAASKLKRELARVVA